MLTLYFASDVSPSRQPRMGGRHVFDCRNPFVPTVLAFLEVGSIQAQMSFHTSQRATNG